MSTQDFDLEFGQDFVLTPAGALQIATGWPQVRERIIRHFLSNPAQVLPDGRLTPADYIFDPNYGIGGGAMVSQNPPTAFTQSLIQRMRQAVLSDAAVDPGSVPQIVVQMPQPNTWIVYVGVQLATGQLGTFSVGTASP